MKILLQISVVVSLKNQGHSTHKLHEALSMFSRDDLYQRSVVTLVADLFQ